MMSKTQILHQQARLILANSNRTSLFRRSFNSQSAVKKDLDQWLKQGHQVMPSYVRGLIKNYRDTSEFSKALQASEWMCERRVFHTFPEDYAARLHLVETVLGLKEAEKYFESIPENIRDYSVYDTLLRSYTKSKNTLDKAEATFEKMRDLGFLLKPSPYKSMISLYGQLKKQDMVKKLKREMKENNLEVDSLTEKNLPSFIKIKRDVCSLWNKYKKEGEQDADKYRSRIRSLLKQDNVLGAEMMFKQWQPYGPKLDMSLPDLLISRFRAEGNQSKVDEVVKSTRNKRIFMYSLMLPLGLISLGMIIGMLAIMDAIIGAIMVAIISLNAWLIMNYPFVVCVCLIGAVITNPILAISLFLALLHMEG